MIRLRFVYKPCVSFFSSFPLLSKTIVLSSPSKPLFSPFVALSLHYSLLNTVVPCLGSVFIIIIKVHLMQEVLCVYRSRFVHVTVASLSSVVSIYLLNLSRSLLFLSLSSLVATRVLAFRVRCIFFITRDGGIPRCGLSVFTSWIFVHEMLLRLSHDDHPVWGFPCS